MDFYKMDFALAIFAMILLRICCAICPHGHSCQNNGICIPNSNVPAGYTCDCSGTEFTGKRCEFLKGSMDFLVPTTMVVGESDIFTMILLKAGDQPRFYLLSDLGFELVDANFRPISDYYSFTSLRRYPSTAMVYQFWYSFSERRDYTLNAGLVNGYTDVTEDYKTFLSQEKRVKISVKNPVFDGQCLPNARLTSVSRHTSFATKYHRTDRIVITLGLKYCDRNSDTLIHYTWKLYRLDKTFPTPLTQNDWGLGDIVPINEKHIILEPYLLMVGHYLIEVEFRAEGDLFNNTRKGFFNVEYNNPKAIIRGGKEITAEFTKTIVLDASPSIDLSFPERTDELVFDWLCSELGSWTDSGSIITLPPNTLPEDSSYTFVVKVYSPRSRITVTESQIIHASRIGIVMSCIKTCSKIHPDDVMLVQCSCPDCSVQPDFIFTWEPQINVIIRQDTPTTALITVPDLQAIYQESAFITCHTTGATAKLELLTSLPPEGGSCTISPDTGVYLIDTFTITCLNFDSADSFLQYEYYAKVNEGVEILGNKLLLYYEQATSRSAGASTIQIQAADIILPFGNESNDILEIVVEVSRDGIVTEKNLIAKVTIPGSVVYLNKLEELILGHDSKLKTLLNHGYEQEALELQSAITFGLIHREIDLRMEPLIDLLQSQNKFSQLVKELSNSLTKISLTNANAIKQVMGCINLLSTLEKDEELNADINDNSYLTESSSTILRVSKEFRNRMRDGAELSLNDVESFGRTVADTTSKILTLMNKRGISILKDETPFVFRSERRLVDQFDLDDDVSRNYFLDDLNEEDEDWGDKELNIETESNEKVAELASATRDAFLALEYMMDTVADQRVVNQDPFLFKDTHLSIHVGVQKANSLENEEFILERLDTSEFSVVKIPGIVKKTESETENSGNIEIRIRELDENPFFDDLSAVPSTPILSVVLKDVESHLPISFDNPTEKSPIELKLPIHKKRKAEKLEASTIYTVPVSDLSQLIDLPEVSDEVLPIRRFVLPYGAQVEITIFDNNPTPDIGYALIFLKDERPTAQHFCDSNSVKYLRNIREAAGEYHAAFETEKWAPGIGESGEKFSEHYIGIWVFPRSPSVLGQNKTFRAYFTRTTCLFRDEDRKIWSEDGCTTKKKYSEESVSCSCEHLSVYSASQFVFPNQLTSIILTDFELGELTENYIVLITVCICFIIYSILFVWCYFYDRRAIAKLVPITIMADLSNDFECAYYLIIVATGTRFDAGTSANISLQIYGSLGRSQTYALKEGGLAVCNRALVDYYLVSSPKDLGELEKIRLWHDNYGDSPSWYCNKIIIRNIKTDVESHFFVEQWLSVSHMDPKLIVLHQIAQERDKHSFYRVYRDNMANEFNNSHLWLSVITRSQCSNFTRCQRLSCAYAVLTSYMLLSIMFYGVEVTDYRNQYEVGGFEFNIKKLIIMMQIVIFSIPISFLLLFFFKHLREYSIPTLIIWKNKTKPDKSEKADNLFVPKAPPPPKVALERKDPFYYEGEGSDSDSAFSLPSTDIREVEGWVISQTEGEEKRSYEDREPDAFIHAIKDENDQDHLDRLHRLGRHALVHTVREADPDSFIFTGDLDIKGVEKLIDEQLNLQAAEKRNSEDRRKIKEIQEPWQNLKTEDLLNIENDMKNNTLQHGVLLVTAEEKKESAKGLVIELCDMPPFHKRWCYLPWWMVYFAWTLCLGVIISCNYFTIIYGLHYGRLKSLGWLETVMASVFTGIFIQQPVKIILVAGLKALCYRQLSNIHQDKFQLLIRDGDKDIKGRKPRKMVVFLPDREHPPLNGHETFLLKMKARRLRELRRKFVYLLLYCFLLGPLIFIAHSTHSEHNYRVTENLRNMFHLEEKSKEFVSNPSEAFLNIKDETSLFGYLRLTFLPALHPTRLYNGNLVTTHRFDAGFLADFTTVLVGVARIRQLRMNETSCEESEMLKKLNSTCISDYSISRQDKSTYNPLWTPVVNGQRLISSTTNDIWRFRTQDETGSLPIKGWMGYYDGGGYIAELGRNRRESASVLRHLKSMKWFDEYTRCIFIEFGTFTPSLNIFTSINLIIEKGSSQGMKMTSYIYPMIVLHPEFTADTDDELSGTVLAVAACLLLIGWMLGVLCVVFVWRILNDSDEDIITRFWFWLDFIIILSLIVSLYIAQRTSHIMHDMTKVLDKMLVNEFVNLQSAALWDQIERVAFSVPQIFCFVRLWNILMHSSQKFLMLTLTLKLTCSILIGFFLLFATLLIAFAFCGNLLFGNYLEEFHTIPHTFITLAQQAIQVDFYYDLENVNRVLGPIYFFCFGIFIIFVTINLFVALLNQGMFQAKEITAERRHWITYWTYTKRFFSNMFATLTHRRVKHRKQPTDRKQSLDILPSRLLEMKQITAKCIKDKFYSDEEALMRKMKHYADDLLKGTGFRMIIKGDNEAAIKTKKERKMEEMRLCTAEFIRIKTGVYMTPKELRKYEKYNTSISALRLNKLERNVNFIAKKIDKIVGGLQPENDDDDESPRDSS